MRIPSTSSRSSSSSASSSDEDENNQIEAKRVESTSADFEEITQSEVEQATGEASKVIQAARVNEKTEEKSAGDVSEQTKTSMFNLNRN